MPEGRPTLSIDALNRAARSYVSRILIGGLVVVILAASGCAIVVANRDAIRAWFAARVGGETGEALYGLTPALPGLAILVCGLHFFARWVRRDRRVQCPHCQGGLVEVRLIVAASRNCPYCGRRVIADPPPPPPPPPGDPGGGTSSGARANSI